MNSGKIDINGYRTNHLNSIEIKLIGTAFFIRIVTPH